MKGFARTTTTTTTTMSIKTMQTIKKQRNKEIWFKKVFSSSWMSSLKMNVEDAGWLCWWWWWRRVSLKNSLRHKELHAMWWSKWDKEENKKARNMKRGKQWHSSDWQMGIMVRKKRSRGGSYYAVNLPQPFSFFSPHSLWWEKGEKFICEDFHCPKLCMKRSIFSLESEQFTVSKVSLKLQNVL